MSSAKGEVVQVYAYKISTPLTNIDTNAMDPEFYSYEFFEGFLDILVSSKNRTFMDGSRYIELVSFKQSDDADIIEGKIHTTRYGTLNNILNVETREVTGQLNPTEGVVNEINFVICRQTGLFLVQSDPFRVANRNQLDNYFTRKQVLAEDLANEYNKQNHPYLLYNNNFFFIETVFNKDFYEQLAKIAKVKEVSITSKVQKPEDNAALEAFKKESDQELDENLVIGGVTEAVYTVKNSIRNGGLKHVERFVKNIVDFEKVSKLEAKGYNEFSKPETASFEVKPVRYPVVTTKNSNGVLDQSEIIKGMVDIAKYKNPLR
ncbi:hypothetical protein MHH67_13265 [Bacillus sp. FSL K6-0047]